MMKYSIIIFFILLSAPIFSQIHPYDIVEREKSHFGKIVHFEKSEAGANIDVTYHRCDWLVDPSDYYIAGNITTHFTATKDNISSISFDFNDVMEVDSVLANGIHLDFSVADHILSITLQNTLALGEQGSVVIYYKGVPADSGFGSFIQSYQNGDPIIWTLSEPYGARDWWPCKQDLVDKIDSIDIIVTSPLAYRAASNGVLISDEVTGNFRTVHWKHRHPIAAYLVAIAVTNYAIYEDYAHLPGGDSVYILNYLYPGYDVDINARNEELKGMLTLFSEKFMDYPYKDEKYGHAQFGWGGGMEHQTMSFMGGLSFYLVAHELAHQWFGDYITCGSWSDIWLNEGFARYCEALVMEHFYPDQLTGWRMSKINNITNSSGGSVYVNDTSSVSRIFSGRLSYDKGGMVLHMLRQELGDEHFFASIRNYLNDPELANGYAKTEDLIAHFENTSDTTLTEFFNDWIYGEGYPIYDVYWSQSDEGIVNLRIEQSQSHESVSFFENTVEILLKGTTRDSLIRIHNTHDNQVVFVNPGFEVNKIDFDPKYHLVSENAELVDVFSLDQEENFKIIPNPAYDYITLENASREMIQRIFIYSISGEIIHQMDIHDNQKEYSFDIGGYSSGTYFIKIESRQKNYLHKFIKRD